MNRGMLKKTGHWGFCLVPNESKDSHPRLEIQIEIISNLPDDLMQNIFDHFLLHWAKSKSLDPKELRRRDLYRYSDREQVEKNAKNQTLRGRRRKKKWRRKDQVESNREQKAEEKNTYSYIRI